MSIQRKKYFPPKKQKFPVLKKLLYNNNKDNENLLKIRKKNNISDISKKILFNNHLKI